MGYARQARLASKACTTKQGQENYAGKAREAYVSVGGQVRHHGRQKFQDR